MPRLIAIAVVVILVGLLGRRIVRRMRGRAPPPPEPLSRDIAAAALRDGRLFVAQVVLLAMPALAFGQLMTGQAMAAILSLLCWLVGIVAVELLGEGLAQAALQAHGRLAAPPRPYKLGGLALLTGAALAFLFGLTGEPLRAGLYTLAFGALVLWFFGVDRFGGSAPRVVREQAALEALVETVDRIADAATRHADAEAARRLRRVAEAGYDLARLAGTDPGLLRRARRLRVVWLPQLAALAQGTAPGFADAGVRTGFLELCDRIAAAIDGVMAEARSDRAAADAATIDVLLGQIGGAAWPPQTRPSLWRRLRPF